MSGIVSASRWALRTAVDAKGQRRGWGVDFARAEFDQGGSGKPACEINLLCRRGSISLRSHKDKRLKSTKTKSGRGHTWNLKNPGHLTIEERDSIDFPDGTRWAPEFGMLSTDLVIEAPGENTWTFDLNLPGCKFAYQPALTEAEVSEGCVRPAWCVGSYAVFDGGLKIGHIARPFARDAKGRWTWGTISISNGVATVTVDKEWMDGATYPVSIDPDIGYTSAGGTSFSANADSLGIYAAGGGSGVATSVKLYGFNDPARSVTMGIYGVDGALLADTAGGNCPTSAAWFTQNLDANYTLVNGALIGVAVIHGTGTMTRYYDTDANCLTVALSVGSAYSAGSLPSHAPSLTIGTTLRRFSLYIVATDPVWPAAGNVRKDTVYGAASELTGTCYVPTAANTRYGVNVDATTGLLEIPNGGTPTGTQDATSDSHVKSGSKYGSPQRTGSYTAASGVNMPRPRMLGV